ncbi:MAG: DUF5723 family protein, partial [Bacteroidota bacterium]
TYGPTPPTHGRMNRVERYQSALVAAAVVVGLAVGQLSGVPPIADALLLPFLMAMLFVAFLGISLSRLRTAFGNRRVAGASLLVNFVWNPLLAVALGAVFLRDQPALWVGLLMLLVTPCTDWYLIFTDLADGNNLRGYVFEDNSEGAKELNFNADLHLPSFMLSFKNGHAMAFTSRFRTVFGVQNVDQQLAKLAIEEFDYEPLLAQGLDSLYLNNDNLSTQTMQHLEFGLGYAAPVFDNGDHFVKVGGQVKLLLGLAAGYAHTENLNYLFYTDDSLSLAEGTRLSYGYSDNISFAEDGDDATPEFRFGSQPGIGFDIGATYEWRPDHARYTYDMDGETDIPRPDQNKYRLRAGFSLTDMGTVRFRRGAFSNDLRVDANNLQTAAHEWSIAGVDFNSFQDFNDTLTNRFAVENQEEDFNVALPMRMSWQIDAHLIKGLYVNLTTVNHFKLGNSGSRNIDNYSITPRYESKWASVAVPLQVSQWAGFNMGLSLRLGPVIFGTNTFSNLFSNEINDVDFYAAVKIPIFKRVPRDSDEDKVSDKVDLCPKTPGIWAFKGCPDTDGDGIQDSEDDCPNTPGLKAFKGCPDRDGDGIIDSKDACPDEAGLEQFDGCPDTDKDGIPDVRDECPFEAGSAEFKGCPDSDGDGIIDKLDKCPDVAGLKAFEGCPDTDEDGIPDYEDECPTKPGLRAHQGCPDTDGDGLFDNEDACPDSAGPRENNGCPEIDTDGDGIPDKIDECPSLAGPAENNGCPYADSDGDGVKDLEDECPNTPGPVENNGCPELEEEEEEALQTAFDNLEFKSGSAQIKATSYESLVKLAEVLKQRPEYSLRISGHTDNVGYAANNMQLSIRRANAVKTFLEQNGIEDDRLITQGFGQTKPIAPNDTEEGRAKNRRVEMEIIFD